MARSARTKSKMKAASGSRRSGRSSRATVIQTKPTSDLFSVMLVLAFLLLLGSIILAWVELSEFYHWSLFG